MHMHKNQGICPYICFILGGRGTSRSEIPPFHKDGCETKQRPQPRNSMLSVLCKGPAASGKGKGTRSVANPERRRRGGMSARSDEIPESECFARLLGFSRLQGPRGERKGKRHARQRVANPSLAAPFVACPAASVKGCRSAATKSLTLLPLPLIPTLSSETIMTFRVGHRTEIQIEMFK